MANERAPFDMHGTTANSTTFAVAVDNAHKDNKLSDGAANAIKSLAAEVTLADDEHLRFAVSVFGETIGVSFGPVKHY